MKKDFKHSDKKKKRKLAKVSEEDESRKKLKLSTIATTSWDVKSILSDPDTALEPLKNFLALQRVKHVRKKDDDDDDDREEKDDDGDEGKEKDDNDDGEEEKDEQEEDESTEATNESDAALAIFHDACDSFIEDSSEFTQLFTLLEKWSKKNSELKVALELFEALLLRLLTAATKR